MNMKLFYDGEELTKVKCPRKFIPPLSLDICKKCRWHHQICCPDNDTPFVVCGFDDIIHDAILEPRF